MKCTRKNCNNAGKHQISKSAIYCDQHYRFSKMTYVANSKYGTALSANEIEALFNDIFPTGKLNCPACQKRMIWHSKYGGRANVITLQHWSKENLGFLCHSCNVRHGKNSDILNIPTDKKHCPECETTKLRTEFHRHSKRLDGLRDTCKSCHRQSSLKYYHKTRNGD